MPDFLITPNGACRPTGEQAIVISGLPSGVTRDLLNALSRRLTAAGYRVKDTRSKPESLCQRCGQRPTASARAKYCPECQAFVIRNRDRMLWGSSNDRVEPQPR